MIMQKTSIHTFIKLLTAGFIFYVLSLIGGVPSVTSEVIRYTPLRSWSDFLTTIVALIFIALFIANIVWASRRNNVFLLLVMPFIYLFLQIIIFYLLAPIPYAVPGQ